MTRSMRPEWTFFNVALEEGARDEEETKDSTGLCLMGSICITLVTGASVSGQEYQALSGVTSVNAVIDFRTGNPRSAAVRLNLVREMAKDSNLTSISENPNFAGCLLGPCRQALGPRQRRALR